jgi:hypothetical protein
MRSRWVLPVIVLCALASLALILTVPALAQAASPQAATPQTAPQTTTPKPAPQSPGLVINGAPSQTATPPAATPQDVAPTAPVITIQGLCSNSNGPLQKGKDCTTVITRAEFERLANALNPDMPPPQRQALADTWAKVLVMQEEAQKHGVDTDPKSKEILRFFVTQTLSNIYNQDLQRAARDIPAADLEAYYQAHQDKFEEVTLRRIFVPKSSPDPAKKLSDAEHAALAQGIQKRAAAGEDFDKLQQEAYTAVGIKTQPPPSLLGAQRRGTLPPPQEQAVFSLKPGEVSGLISDNAADYIYKVESKRMLPLDAVRNDIIRVLGGEKYQQEMFEVFEGITAQLNQQYFGPTATITLPQKPAAAPTLTPKPTLTPRPSPPK